MTSKTEKPKRLTPKPDVLRKLFLLSGNECAMDGCSTVIIDNSGTMTGEVAHIAAAMPDGPRFDKTMTNEQRRSFENLVLLCATHHTQFDGKGSKVKARKLKLIKSTHEARFSAVETTIRKRFETQFPDTTDDLSPTLPQTLAGLQCVLGEGALSDGDVETEVPKLGEYVKKLAIVPERHRDFMCQLIRRCAKLDSWHHDRASVPCDDLHAALSIGATKQMQIVQALEGYGIGTFAEDFDNRPLIDLWDPADYVGWCDITTFCSEEGLPLERFVVDLQFDLLDGTPSTSSG